uniref:Uncharacterized protein n=1 Tax=Anopheles melas TaxID=34690 RepID=A0A182THP0_9DIPT
MCRYNGKDGYVRSSLIVCSIGSLEGSFSTAVLRIGSASGLPYVSIIAPTECPQAYGAIAAAAQQQPSVVQRNDPIARHMNAIELALEATVRMVGPHLHHAIVERTEQRATVGQHLARGQKQQRLYRKLPHLLKPGRHQDAGQAAVAITPGSEPLTAAQRISSECCLRHWSPRGYSSCSANAANSTTRWFQPIARMRFACQNTPVTSQSSSIWIVRMHVRPPMFQILSEPLRAPVSSICSLPSKQAAVISTGSSTPFRIWVCASVMMVILRLTRWSHTMMKLSKPQLTTSRYSPLYSSTETGLVWLSPSVRSSAISGQQAVTNSLLLATTSSRARLL